MSLLFPQALREVLAGQTLAVDRARRAMGAVLSGGSTPAQAGAFVGALAMRGPTADELVGFGQAMRERCAHVAVRRAPLLEISCGEFSTAAAFIAAAAGAAVAQQVGRGADVLAALGVRVETEPAQAARCAEEAGVGFFPSERHHPALSSVQSLRQELGVRTIFNLLEPLANPAGARSQLLGVYVPGLVPLLARALKTIGSESSMVISSRDGLEAFSVGAPTAVAHLSNGRIEQYEVDAAALGLPRARPSARVEDDTAADARVLLGILRGERGPAFDAALLNAAAALMIAGLASDFKDGLARAAEAVDSCRALRVLELVKKLSA